MQFRSNRPRRRSILSLLKERLDDLEERLELIEDEIGINSFMANDEGNVGGGNVGGGNVGVGSTAPTPIQHVYEGEHELENKNLAKAAAAAKQDAETSGPDDGNVGVGSSA